MSNLKITLKSFAAIGALSALGFAAQADDTKPKAGAVVHVEKEASVDGSIERRVSDKVSASTIAPQSEERGITRRVVDQASRSMTVKAPSDADHAVDVKAAAGCEPYPACARNKEFEKEQNKIPAPIHGGDVQGDVESEGDLALAEPKGAGEDTYGVNLAYANGPDEDVQGDLKRPHTDIDIDGEVQGDVESEGDIALAGPDDDVQGDVKRPHTDIDIDGEVQGDVESEGNIALAGPDDEDLDTLGEHVGPKATRGGEDRLTENVEMKKGAAGNGDGLDRIEENLTLKGR